jgi:hypothetical protein
MKTDDAVEIAGHGEKDLIACGVRLMNVHRKDIMILIYIYIFYCIVHR